MEPFWGGRRFQSTVLKFHLSIKAMGGTGAIERGFL